MSKQTWKPGTLLDPAPPVLVSCGPVDWPNLITIAWCGTVCSQPPMLSVSIKPERCSHKLITESGVFAVNLPTQKLLRAVDWCGVKSGRDVDKFAEMGLTPVPATRIDTVLLDESPVNLECRVRQILPLGSHDMFVAEIVAVDVDEALLDDKGKLHLDRAGLIAYSHGEYYALGRRLGSFGCSVRKNTRRPAGTTR